ncbi:MAG TPA: hypothetical protein VG797_09840 [Phycisphaerales bacterium]|nr:hypothetical protein [Phycisphaerales bacterium]
MSSPGFRSVVFWAALATVGLSAAGFAAGTHILGVHLSKKPVIAVDPAGKPVALRTLPAKVPGWERFRDDEIMSKEGTEELGTENYVSRIYRRTDTKPGQPESFLDFHCAYYTGTIDTVPHVPERCFVGRGGMEIAGPSQLVDVPIDTSRFLADAEIDSDKFGVLYTSRSPVTHTRFRLPRGIEKLQLLVTPFRAAKSDRVLYAGYFFIANGRVVATADAVRTMAFSLENVYSYYMKVEFRSITAQSASELAAMAGKLLDELLPEIAQRVPDWVQVTEGHYPGAGAVSSPSETRPAPDAGIVKNPARD